MLFVERSIDNLVNFEKVISKNKLFMKKVNNLLDINNLR